MSQLSYAPEYAPVEEWVAPAAIPWVDPPQRSILQPILLGLPILFAAGGYLLSSGMLTDTAFIILTVLCTIFLMGDLRRFSERYGLGGVVLFGGVLIWFCYDYFNNWFLKWTSHWSEPISQSTIAKSAMYHMIYILCLTIGIRIKTGRWFSQLLNKLPESPNPTGYFIIVLFTQVIGLYPYMFFTHEPFILALVHQITGGRSGLGTHWTVGRTGNLNFNWGAYLAQMLQVGEFGAVVASFCIIFLRQSVIRNIICAAIWLLWMALGFGTGSRGEIVIFMLPLICFIFIRYHVQAQEFLHKYSVRAYVFVGSIMLFSLVLVQIQIHYRNAGFGAIKLSEVSLTNIAGNSMFSEGLVGFSYIPERHTYFYDVYPGQTLIMPIPNFLYWAAVAPMPRALWTTKPVDPFWKWYNAVSTGRSTLGGGTTEGTTIAEGIVGYWYFRFGIAGVVEGGIFMGWIIGRVERALYNNGGRPLAFLASLAFLTWMFRSFRGADLQDLADTFVVLFALIVCMVLVRPFIRSGAASFPA